jgi:type IV pilus assembly protein PilA
MRRNKGFTLIELMVVILIVAILAAVLAPMMSGRIRSAKWSEAKAGCGTIATALRAYVAEHEGKGDIASTSLSGTGMSALGIDPEDLNGKYCSASFYQVTNFTYSSAAGAQPVHYTITVTPTGTKGVWANGESLTLIMNDTSVNYWRGPQ